MIDKKLYIQEFKELYQKKNNSVISDELALEYFENLIVLVKTVYKPIKKKQNMIDTKLLDSLYPNEPTTPYQPKNFEEFFKLMKYDADDDGSRLFDMENDKVPEPILWDDLSRKTFEEQSWRIKNLIPKQGFVVLASISGEKKTWLAMEMAKSIVSDEDFLGEERFKTEGANVLYINGENAESEIQRRGKQLRIEPDYRPFKFYFTSTDNINLNKHEGAIWLKAFVKYYKIEVVFIDTFIATAGGLKEEKAEDIRQFFNRFNSLKNTGVVVIWLMHMRKPTNFEGRIPKKEQLLGSQDKTASIEILLMLSSQAGSEEINVYQRKNRLGVEIPPFKIGIRDGVGENNAKETFLTYEGELEETENKKEQAKELIFGILENEGKQTNQILELTKKQVGSKNTRNALAELVKVGLIKITRKGKQNYYFLNETSEELQQTDVSQFKNNLDLF